MSARPIDPLDELRRLHPELPDGDLRALAAGDAVMHPGPTTRYAGMPPGMTLDDVTPEPGECPESAAWRAYWAAHPIRTPEEHARHLARLELLRGLRELQGDERDPDFPRPKPTLVDAIAIEVHEETREAFGLLLGRDEP